MHIVIQVSVYPGGVLPEASTWDLRRRQSGKEDETANSGDMGNTGLAQREQSLDLGRTNWLEFCFLYPVSFLNWPACSRMGLTMRKN